MKKVKKEQKYNKIFQAFELRKLACLNLGTWHRKYQPEQPVQDFRK